MRSKLEAFRMRNFQIRKQTWVLTLDWMCNAWIWMRMSTEQVRCGYSITRKEKIRHEAEPTLIHLPDAELDDHHQVGQFQCSLSFRGRDFSKSRAAIRSRLTAFEEGSITLEGPFMETPVVSTRLHNNIVPNNTQPIASPSPQTVTAVWLNGLTGPAEQEKNMPGMSKFRRWNQTCLCKSGRPSIL